MRELNKNDIAVAAGLFFDMGGRATLRVPLSIEALLLVS